jgi:hypothetical protein
MGCYSISDLHMGQVPDQILNLDNQCIAACRRKRNDPGLQVNRLDYRASRSALSTRDSSHV